jgi:hypothetical protein
MLKNLIHPARLFLSIAGVETVSLSNLEISVKILCEILICFFTLYSLRKNYLLNKSKIK